MSGAPLNQRIGAAIQAVNKQTKAVSAVASEANAELKHAQEELARITKKTEATSGTVQRDLANLKKRTQVSKSTLCLAGQS